ncbi:hypothetical protein Bbelb_019410 [Branchiostoma belcheri]|nr:hypothetical protein Bbelb_019410 [Branchiostoma belcheri]
MDNEARRCFLDGTLKVVGEPFYQLFSIHAFLESGSPVLRTYVSPEEAGLHDSLAPPGCATSNSQRGECEVDFEEGMWRALPVVFPDINIKRHAFHWKHAQQLGLQDEKIHRWLRRLLALPWMPAEAITPALAALEETDGAGAIRVRGPAPPVPADDLEESAGTKYEASDKIMERSLAAVNTELSRRKYQLHCKTLSSSYDPTKKVFREVQSRKAIEWLDYVAGQDQPAPPLNSELLPAQFTRRPDFTTVIARSTLIAYLSPPCPPSLDAQVSPIEPSPTVEAARRYYKSKKDDRVRDQKGKFAAQCRPKKREAYTVSLAGQNIYSGGGARETVSNNRTVEFTAQNDVQYGEVLVFCRVNCEDCPEML